MKNLDQSRARRATEHTLAGGAGKGVPTSAVEQLDWDTIDERDVINGVYYPSSDGQPMAETRIHVRAMVLLLQALEDLYEGRGDVFLAADLFWYWVEGDNTARCAPDVMVIPGVEDREQRSFMTWLENGAIPTVIFEMASKNTWREDVGPKYELYQRLGVKEYFIFDPETKYVRPPLQGFRLRKKAYQSIKPAADGSLVSKELGVHIAREKRMLRLADVETGKLILTRKEQAEQAQQRADEQQRQAEEQRQRAEQAQQQAVEERHRADEAEAENARLRALLEKKSRRSR
jgi:Uma2 family endonuclease